VAPGARLPGRADGGTVRVPDAVDAQALVLAEGHVVPAVEPDAEEREYFTALAGTATRSADA